METTDTLKKGLPRTGETLTGISHAEAEEMAEQHNMHINYRDGKGTTWTAIPSSQAEPDPTHYHYDGQDEGE